MRRARFCAGTGASVQERLQQRAVIISLSAPAVARRKRKIFSRARPGHSPQPTPLRASLRFQLPRSAAQRRDGTSSPALGQPEAGRRAERARWPIHVPARPARYRRGTCTHTSGRVIHDSGCIGWEQSSGCIRVESCARRGGRPGGSAWPAASSRRSSSHGWPLEASWPATRRLAVIRRARTHCRRRCLEEWGGERARSCCGCASVWLCVCVFKYVCTMSCSAAPPIREQDFRGRPACLPAFCHGWAGQTRTQKNRTIPAPWFVNRCPLPPFRPGRLSRIPFLGWAEQRSRPTTGWQFGRGRLGSDIIARCWLECAAGHLLIYLVTSKQALSCADRWPRQTDRLQGRGRKIGR